MRELAEPANEHVRQSPEGCGTGAPAVLCEGTAPFVFDPHLMLLSQRCEYAIRAALYLAARAPAGPVPVREVSRALDIPHAFLAKTVRDLVQAGVMTSQAGPGGGLALARPSEELTFKDVVLVDVLRRLVKA